MTVNFYDRAEDGLIKYAVIASRYKDKWVYCKHRERSTYEIPGGHREEGETPEEAAVRELKEETGAKRFDIFPVCVYSVKREGEGESFGMLYFAEIREFEEKKPEFEIEKAELFDEPPSEQTYPLIQPRLLEKVIKERGMTPISDKCAEKI